MASLPAVPKPWLAPPSPGWSRVAEDGGVKRCTDVPQPLRLGRLIWTVGVASAQANRIVVERQARSCWNACLVDDGAGNFPTAKNRMRKARCLEDGQLVDVVHAEDLAAIEATGSLHVLNVEWIVDARVVSTGDVDFVRVGVIDFTAESPTALDTEAGLETVVVAVGVVFLLGNSANPSIDTDLVRNRDIRAAWIVCPSGCSGRLAGSHRDT